MGVSGAVLAIDAGNSKTDVAVVTADGEVAGTARGGGFRPPATGVERALDTLAEAVGRAQEAAGHVPVAHVSACLANADLPVEEERLAAATAARGWGQAVEVRNDTFAVLRAGLLEDADPRGVAVVCGAGINCAGMVPDGRTARFPALGRVSGDWGGGGGLAEEALWHAARAEDGRGEPTTLARALPAHFGLDTMYALIEALHLGHVPPARRHELTPVLFTVAEAGDPVAAGLITRLAEEVATMAAVALDRQRLVGQADQARRLAESERFRMALLAAVSPDLRTPLTGIKASVTSLRSAEVEWSPEDRTALLEGIEDGADRLDALIGNLLDMSRLTTGTVVPLLRETGLDEVVPRALAGVPEGSVVLDIPESLPLVTVDRGLLERVVANLVENAVKYSPGDRPVLISAGALLDRVELRVVDRGPGVPDASKEQIFEPFQRLGDAPRGAGVGLGLAVARGFTEAIGATLTAEDTPGGGLTMVLGLPRADAGESSGKRA